MARAPIKPVPVMTPQDYARFEASFTKNKTTGCWEWHKTISSGGYGEFFAQKRSLYAHRLSWVHANKRDIPAGMLVCHKCDNRKCVNPEHLEIGDHLKNMRDSVERGRRAKFKPYEGKAAWAKLSKAQMAEIARSDLPSPVLAEMYGVCAERCNDLKRKAGKRQRRSAEHKFIKRGEGQQPDAAELVLMALRPGPETIDGLARRIEKLTPIPLNRSTLRSTVWRIRRFGMVEKDGDLYRAV